jgi:hypothetical protein
MELDDVPAFVIKDCSEIFIPILSFVINLSNKGGVREPEGLKLNGTHQLMAYVDDVYIMGENVHRSSHSTHQWRQVTGEWRKLHNEELHNLYSSPDIIRQVKSRRMR